MRTLAELVGRQIFAIIPTVKSDGAVTAVLQGLEGAGVWLEIPEQDALLIAAVKGKTGPLEGKLVLFYPWHLIQALGQLPSQV